MKEVYVVFDGPPSNESGRFVEVETKEQEGVGGIPWEKFASAIRGPQGAPGNTYWRLGPFFIPEEGDGGLAAKNPAAAEIQKLADFIIAEIPGEPSHNQSTVETAIRLLRASREKEVQGRPIF